jgi:hypothetical protein
MQSLKSSSFRRLREPYGERERLLLRLRLLLEFCRRFGDLCRDRDLLLGLIGLISRVVLSAYENCKLELRCHRLLCNVVLKYCTVATLTQAQCDKSPI